LPIIFVSAELDVNVARGKKTFASSPFSSSSTSCVSPQTAVDGNYDIYYSDNSCFATGDSPGGPNWWAVDMRLLVFVDRVILTNRANEECAAPGCCESLTGHFIGHQSIMLWQYRFCCKLNYQSINQSIKYLFIIKNYNPPERPDTNANVLSVGPLVGVRDNMGFPAGIPMMSVGLQIWQQMKWAESSVYKRPDINLTSNGLTFRNIISMWNMSNNVQKEVCVEVVENRWR